MKTLFTFTLLSFIAITTVTADAQKRSTRNRTTMKRIVIGTMDRYYHNDYLANRVRRLESVVNQMQDHIVSLERSIYSSNTGNGNYGNSSYFCEIVASFGNRRIYTGKARSKREASSIAYSKCVRGENNSYSCQRNRVKCDSNENSRY